MRDRPILYSGPMIRALLSDLKAQTRRTVNEKTLRVRLRDTVTSDPSPVHATIRATPGAYRAKMNQHGAVSIFVGGSWLGVKPGEFDFVCPYADGRWHLADHGGGRRVWTMLPDPGQRLWVRETWGHVTNAGIRTVYRADGDPRDRFSGEVIAGMKWRPSIFMRRHDSRMTLEVTGVRVERLQDISEEDAKAEGISTSVVTPNPREPINAKNYIWAREAFADLWRSINGADSWDANPWVWVVNFKRIESKEKAA